MKLPHYLSLTLALPALFAHPAAQASEAPPKPPIDSYTLTLDINKEQKLSIEFILVKVSEDSNIFSSKDFYLGESIDAGYSYKLTSAAVGGTLYYINPKRAGATPYWAIPMAKTALTQAQYAAIMASKSDTAKPEEPENPNHPQVLLSKAQILDCIDQFNVLFHKKNASGQSPAMIMRAACAQKVNNKNLHGRLVARLPTEAEWEFAARGGLNVDASFFKKMYPYSSLDELAASEVVAQQTSGTSREVASTGRTNPCGLYDMLGNVSEVVDNTFCPEYLFGRVGGILLRGGYWATDLPEADSTSKRKPITGATSFFRQEVPHFHGEGPYKSDRMGFRLVLGSDITGSGLSNVIDKDKVLIGKKNKAIRSRYASPSDSVDDRIDQVNSDVDKTLGSLLSYLKKQDNQRSTERKLQKELSQKNLTVEQKDKIIKEQAVLLAQRDEQINVMSSEISVIKQEIDAAAEFIEESQETMAKAGVELILSSSIFSIQSMNTIIKDSLLLNTDIYTSEEKVLLRNKIKRLEGDIEADWQRFENGCMALMRTKGSAVEKEFARRDALLKSRGMETDRHCFQIAKQIYRNIKSRGKCSDDDREQWEKELRAVIKKIHAKN